MADNTPSADIVDTLCQRVSAHIATYACAATIYHRYHAVEKSLREGSAYPPPILAAAAILTASKLWAVSDLMMSETLGSLVRVLVDEVGDCGSPGQWKDVHGAVLGAELSLLCTIGYDVSLSYPWDMLEALFVSADNAARGVALGALRKVYHRAHVLRMTPEEIVKHSLAFR